MTSPMYVQVPDYVQGELPTYHDAAVWVFLPFFYSPLFLALVFSVGIGFYHLIR